MDSTEKHAVVTVTPTKPQQKSKPKTPKPTIFTENRNPNSVSSSSISTPAAIKSVKLSCSEKTHLSPAVKSASSAKKLVSGNSNPNNLSLSCSSSGIKPAKQSGLERVNSNVSSSSSSSPMIKSAKKLVTKSPNDHKLVMYDKKNKIRERRFVVVKKNAKKVNSSNSNLICDKCKEKNEMNKCLCIAYESLRASQEDFFAKKSDEEEKKGPVMVKDLEFGDDCLPSYESNTNELDDAIARIEKMGDVAIKRNRVNAMELVRTSVAQLAAYGNVKNLVKAFETLTFLPTSSLDESEGKDENELDDTTNVEEVTKWTLPGLVPKAPASSEETLSFSNSGLMDAHISSSWDSTRESISSRTSSGGKKARRNSTESTGTMGGDRHNKKHLRVTSQKPFKLRTELRGRVKEEELVKKIQTMMEEQEKQRIPVAQGLPWTTDEPECLVKPPVKDITRPVDLMLHSDIRAVERAEFDHQVAEKLSFIEQYKLEKERQRMLEEEEERRRLRKELIPKAQPMPFFDRPFVPIRSMKNPTVPKEPKFNIPEHKMKIRCCLSMDDVNPFTLNE